MLTSLWFVSNL